MFGITEDFCMINDGELTFITTEEENVFHLYRNDGESTLKKISFCDLTRRITILYDLYLENHLHTERHKSTSISVFPIKDHDWTIMKICVSKERM